SARTATKSSRWSIRSRSVRTRSISTARPIRPMKHRFLPVSITTAWSKRLS
ncbi:hypothetical protein LPJCHP_LPJCHP_12395, partial [Dysosmobacter welbionis]